MPRKNIVWLASYPKSGNTWTRIFLANYLLNPDKPLPINQVHRIGMGDAVSGAYKMVNGGRYDPIDYKGHLKQRPKVLAGITNNGADLNFVKTHNLNDKAFGHKLIDASLTRSAVYIVRNPLDVAVSYARHYGQTPSEACRAIGRVDNTTAADAGNVMQYLGNWSDHVRGWTKTKAFPVHVMRYEDMQADPETAFTALLDFIGVPVESDKVTKAVGFSAFDEVSRQEAKGGFIEQSRNNTKFFHTGQSGQWQDTLSEEDIAHMRQKHGSVMRTYGYL
ncbi:MAG: sulfotransferase domain-containing protein [Paracoccaceae bacterium]